MLYGLILVIHIIACLVLIAVILLQAGRGGGVADTFGGTAQSIFGSRGAAFLTRATTVCAILFMLTSLTLAFLSARQGHSLMESSPATQKLPQKQAAPAAPGPKAEPPPAPAKQNP